MKVVPQRQRNPPPPEARLEEQELWACDLRDGRSAPPGVAMPIGGSQQNGDAGLLYGGGVSLKYRVSEKWDVGVAYAWEEWSALRVRHVEHFGLVLNYRF